jgi:hypothetical protein
MHIKMKQYIIHLKVEDYDPAPKEKKEIQNIAILKLREKSKALILKQLEVKLKAKEMVHVKNDSPLPFVVLMLDQSKIDEQVDFLRKLDVVEMIEVDYGALSQASTQAKGQN